MDERKANSQVDKSNKKECLSDSNEQSQQALSAPQVQESSSSNVSVELIKAQAALKALENRFAEVVAENIILRMETKQVKALQTQNQQLQAQLARHEQELSRSRDDSTFELDDLKRELAFSR